MARRRWIDPSFWDDLSIGRLTVAARLFFLGCVSHADDEGRLPGDPAWLRRRIFPNDLLPTAFVQELRDKVVGATGLMLYEADGSEYLAFVHWRRYQRPRPAKPSELPAPPDVDVALDNAVPEHDLVIAKWEGLRSEILARDGYECRYCGESEGLLHIDHVIPRAQGGSSHPDNLVTACWACNTRKGPRTPEEAGMELLDG